MEGEGFHKALDKKVARRRFQQILVIGKQKDETV